MAISVTHSTVVVVPDDGTSPVGTDEWNAGHTVTGAAVLASANHFTDTTDSTSTATGAVIIDGGLGVAKRVISGDGLFGPYDGSFAKGFHFGTPATTNTRFATSDGSYVQFYDAFDVSRLVWGPVADNRNIYNSATHEWNAYNGSTLYARLNSTNLDLKQTTASSSSSTGALTVAGGVGVGGNLNAGGYVSADATAGVLLGTHALAANVSGYHQFYDTDGSARLTFGPLGDPRSIYSGTTHRFSNLGDSTSFATINATALALAQTTASSSTSTGALTVAGGVGIAGSFYMGGATLQMGDDGASPAAKTFQVQSVVAGTSNTAGADFTIVGSRGTGTGAGGDIIFKTAPASTTGTSQNTAVEVGRTGFMPVNTQQSTNINASANSSTIVSTQYLIAASNTLTLGAGAILRII